MFFLLAADHSSLASAKGKEPEPPLTDRACNGVDWPDACSDAGAAARVTVEALAEVGHV